MLRLLSALRAHDRPIVRQPLLRFCSLQRLQVVLRYPRQPAFGPSRFDVAPAAIQIPPEVGLSGADTIPAVFPPCVHRALGPRRAFVVTIHTGPIRVIRHGLSFARRSATRLIEPFHDWAEPAFNGMVRQRSWDSFSPFAVFLVRGFPAFLRFIPTCRYPNHPRASPLIFTGCRSPLCKTPSDE